MLANANLAGRFGTFAPDLEAVYHTLSGFRIRPVVGT